MKHALVNGRNRPTDGRCVFELSSATVAFEGVPVFEDVNLCITRGSFTVLLGPNGSGKTTMVRAMMGLQPLTSGEVFVEGMPLGRFRDWSRVTFMPQRLPGTSGVPVSVLELVRAARISPRSRWRLIDRRDTRIALEALEAVGLADRRRSRVDTLSGGQQRRVMIARALAEGADTLILDEPFAGVDLASQADLATLLGELSDRTIVMVAHGLGSIAELVTRAIVLDEGRIVHDGATAPAAMADIAHHSSGSRRRPTLMDQ